MSGGSTNHGDKHLNLLLIIYKRKRGLKKKKPRYPLREREALGDLRNRNRNRNPNPNDGGKNVSIKADGFLVWGFVSEKSIIPIQTIIMT